MQTDNNIVIKQETIDEICEDIKPSVDSLNQNNDNSNDLNSSINNNSSMRYTNTKFQMRRGRKTRRLGNKVDIKAKLERSRQSARECRARKKLRYQYLEDLVVKRENANLLLKKELDMLVDLCKKRDAESSVTHTELNRVDDEKRKNNRRA